MDPESQPESTSSAVSAASASASASSTAPASAVSEAEPEPETVLVRVPADPDYLAVIRSASAHVATKFGCTLSEVADFRLAVDEACGLLLRHTVGDLRDPGAGDLECRFVLEPSVLRVVLSRQARDVARPADDDFGWTILSALVDDIIWRVDGPTVHVELVKRRTAGS
ncbi:ATP-binding protein [Catenulispora rubra]|uniref:ATP-binding protein n=1 Tax=Catenulispora rubra TaxID=280293 RepID=UPI001891F9E1|nr:ATP-binding protein [Catenulispora rubra]